MPMGNNRRVSWTRAITRHGPDRIRHAPPRPSRCGGEHPGMANYPSDATARVPTAPRRRARAPTAGCHRSTRRRHSAPTADPTPPRGGRRQPAGSVTVTRAAAQRSREMGSKMYGLFQRAATADGADKSGLTALTYPVMANFAADAAMAVALANTLFFAAASGESKSKVALYLLITIAPFAVIAPLIGPALDRLQHGRRVALATSFALRTALAVVLIANYDGANGSFPPWVLYPCALGMMVLSKSFSVLRSAVTPRVLPPTIDLVRVNSRLTMFGLLGGTIVGGGDRRGRASTCSTLFQLPGALYVVVAVTVAGAVLSMRIPKWVEVTDGEVPTTLSYHGPTEQISRRPSQPRSRSGPTTVGPQHHHLAVGQLHHQGDGRLPVPLPGVRRQVARRQRLGAAAHPRPDRRRRGRSATSRATSPPPGSSSAIPRSWWCAAAIAVTAGRAGHRAHRQPVRRRRRHAGHLGRQRRSPRRRLDASLQDDLPEESRASAFGRSESLLQLAWVAGRRDRAC